MVDELLSDKDKDVQEMKVQEDYKRLDHLYRYHGLTTEEKKVFYIGDSKYYPLGAKIPESSVAKQYTYARNLVQYHINLFNSDKKSDKEKAHIYRDEITEGYDIVPNFFISAKIDDISKEGYKDSKIELIKHKNKNFLVSCHFKNRLYDRDTILVSHYNINFLFVLALYAKNRSYEQQNWAEEVKNRFREEILAGLNKEFQFHIMTPREHVNEREVLKQNFKDLLGKVFQPYPDGENGQKFYSLALEKPETIENERDKNAVASENQRIKDLLEPYFEVIECNIGEDKRNKFTTPPPDGVIYAEDMVLVGYANKEQRERYIDKKLYYTRANLEKGSLRLKAGFESTKFLLMHDGNENLELFELKDSGPRIVSKQTITDLLEHEPQHGDFFILFEIKSSEPIKKEGLKLPPSKRGKGANPEFMRLREVLK